MTRTQIANNIKDSVEQFYQDTLKSARDLARPDLIKVLTGRSASAVEWLQDKFELDLSLVSRLGGHSFPRTHRGKEQFPGMTITYALMEGLEELAVNEPERVKIVKRACVEELIRNGNEIIGVKYVLVGKDADGKTYEAYGPTILATGGYAADFSANSLLKKHRPELFDLSTTNGDHCTGDGIKMASAAGANTIDMEKVQVHPTGLVDPKEPEAKVKFLAAEALRGCGGLLLDAEGNRFCDELGHRDYVTGMMWKNKFPIRLILNTAASKEIEWHCRHYAGRGLMKKFDSGADLAKEMGISPAKLKETFETYNSIAEGKVKDPWGKRFFHNVPIKMEDYFYVAHMQPVLHYTMVRITIFLLLLFFLVVFLFPLVTNYVSHYIIVTIINRVVSKSHLTLKSRVVMLLSLVCLLLVKCVVVSTVPTVLVVLPFWVVLSLVVSLVKLPPNICSANLSTQVLVALLNNVSVPLPVIWVPSV